eukprot:scaffold42806_cov237-Amphora_coffeaeformis.AAC.1
MLAAYFALYESFVTCFQLHGAERLDQELGVYYQWFFSYNKLYELVPAKDVPTTVEKAQVVAVLELVAALPVVVMRNKLWGLCLLSYFYMVAVRGHLQLNTPYVPVVLTMFGFSHVALVATVFTGFTSGAGSEETATTEEEQTPETTEEDKPKGAQTATGGSSKNKTNKKKKTKAS